MLKEYVGIGYVKVVLDNAKGKLFGSILGALKAENLFREVCGVGDFHCTLAYDRSNPVRSTSMTQILNPDVTYNAKIVDVKEIGNAVALFLESPSLVARHNELSIFFEYDFPDFIPHVSLAYDALSDESSKVVIDAFRELIGMEISLYGESGQTIREKN